jgi:hypothetical protein
LGNKYFLGDHIGLSNFLTEIFLRVDIALIIVAEMNFFLSENLLSQIIVAELKICEISDLEMISSEMIFSEMILPS